MSTVSSKQARSACRELVEMYRASVLSQEFQVSTRRRELARLFPFSLHNIYRVLLTIAQDYFAGFAALAERMICGNPLPVRLLGSPTRVCRYFHVALVGAVDWSRPPRMPESNLRVLERLAPLVMHRIASGRDIPPAERARCTAALQATTIAPTFASMLAVFLRECVDYLCYGQHDHGYSVHPPVRTVDGTVVVRRFSRLPFLARCEDEVEVATVYRGGGEGGIRFNAARGDVENLPGPGQLVRGSACVIEHTGPRLLDEHGVRDLLARVEEVLDGGQAALSAPGTSEIERRVGLMFCTELFDLLSSCGLSSWRGPIEGALASIPASGWPAECLTDVYAARLRCALDLIERSE